MERIALRWHGPIDLQVFEAPRPITLTLDVSSTGKPVVYLWCMRINYRGGDGLAVYYVGSTRRFPERMREHYDDWINGKSSLFNPRDVVRGEINIVYMPNYDKWVPGLDQVAKENVSLIKIFWAVVQDEHEKEVEGVLKVKLWRKQETRGYQCSQEQMRYKIHHNLVENFFPEGCNIIGL
jgi:hypothetical protein